MKKRIRFLNVALLVLLTTSFMLVLTQIREQHNNIQWAQASNVVTPSFFPLAPCPTCESPSVEPVPSGNTQIPEASISSVPVQNPCTAGGAELAADDKKENEKKVSKHKRHDGKISKGFSSLVKQLFELLTKLLELFFGSGSIPINLPQSNDDVYVPTTKLIDDGTPQPCPSQAQPQPSSVQSQPSSSITPAGLAPSQPAATNQPVPPSIAGNWKLVFQDEFSGTVVDTAKWSFVSSAESTCTGDGKSLESGCSNPSNQQLEFNWGKNCTVANGILTITAKKEVAGGRQWTSCMLHSIPKFQTMYMEARIKIPSTSGFWPAFWTWEGPSNEVDVFEYYTGSKQFSMTNHTGSKGGCDAPGFDPTDGYHVYAADIYAGGVRFYIDGKEQCNTTGSPSAPVSLLLDMFVHDQQIQAANSVTMETDYIRAWQKQ